MQFATSFLVKLALVAYGTAVLATPSSLRARQLGDSCDDITCDNVGTTCTSIIPDVFSVSAYRLSWASITPTDLARTTGLRSG